MKKVEIGKVYAFDVDCFYPAYSKTYTVKVLEMFDKEYAKCESMQTGDIYRIGIQHLSEIEIIEAMHEYVKAKLTPNESEFSANSKIFRRTGDILRAITASKEIVSSLLSWLDTRIDITPDDVSTLDSLIDICLDKQDRELFDKVTKLKEKLTCCSNT